MQLGMSKHGARRRKQRISGAQREVAAYVFATMLGLLSCTGAYAADNAHVHHGKAEGLRPGVVSLDVCADGEQVHVLTATRDAQVKLKFQYVKSTDDGETWSDA